MKVHPNQTNHGFTLTELAVVLSIVGVIIGAIWSYAQKARQATKVEQSIEAITQIVDATRNAYVASPSINGGISTVMNILTNSNSFPQAYQNSQVTACPGAGANFYAGISPWGNPGNSLCGTLGVCAWTYGNIPVVDNTSCGSIVSGSSQFFSIEFSQLDYNSCLSLVETQSASQPTGLKDVYINGQSGAVASNGLPVSPTNAANFCIVNNPGVPTPPNTVDFVYALRAPLT